MAGCTYPQKMYDTHLTLCGGQSWAPTELGGSGQIGPETDLTCANPSVSRFEGLILVDHRCNDQSIINNGEKYEGTSGLRRETRTRYRKRLNGYVAIHQSVASKQDQML